MRHECKRCGSCCSPGFFDGAHGVVNFSPEDQQRAARFLGLSLVELRARYINGNNTIDLGDAPCTFLDPDTHHCSVHEVRPHGCRIWPREHSLARHKKRCPGIKE